MLFLPINGRDPARGVPGNMTAAEAVDLAAAVRPRFVVPHHYDMFTFNTVPVEEFRGRGAPAPRRGRAADLAVRRALGDHAVSVTLGIDIGTSGTKTLAIDEKGTILASASAEYPCDHPRPGWSEQDPELWWEATRSDGPAGPGLGPVPAGRCGGIGLSGQMHGSVFLDAAGKVIRPALLWNDQRTAAECHEIEDEGRRPRGLDPAGRQPGPDRLHGPQAPLGPQPRAASTGSGCAGLLAQGLRPLPADRDLRDRGQRRLGHAPARRRQPPLEPRALGQARPRPGALARLATRAPRSRPR